MSSADSSARSSGRTDGYGFFDRLGWRQRTGRAEVLLDGHLAGNCLALAEGGWDTTALMPSNADTVRETTESLPYVELAG